MANATTRLFVAGILMVLPAVAAKASRASRDNACTAPTVTIYLEHTMRMNAVEETRAVYVASRAFQSIGVLLKWREGTPTPEAIESHCGEIIELQIDPVAPRGRTLEAAAYATPGASSGTRIHIFYDRVKELAPNVPNLYGYVLAHEIGHVLQRMARHSAEGIMKARWDGSDYNSMGVYALRFTLEDAALIRDRAKPNRGARSLPSGSDGSGASDQ